jgi:TRAP-type uncharacterized transport system substrate-binding protein
MTQLNAPRSAKAWRDLALIALPALLLVCLALYAASRYVTPAPPKRVVMSTGAEDGIYHRVGLRYRELLAHHGIDLELRSSNGSAENLARLRDRNSEVELALVQAGLEPRPETSGLMSLGSVYYEPMWVFYRSGSAKPIDRLSSLQGQRLAVGSEGSGTRSLALQLLQANNMDSAPTQLLALSGVNAAMALRQGDVDAVFLVGSAELPAVRILLFERGIRLLHFSRAAAYTKLFDTLSAVTLPQGSIDLVRDIPLVDTTLLATTATVLARDTLHPALAGLLAQAMNEVHAGASKFNPAGAFPRFTSNEFPPSAEAQRQFKNGPPFLQRYLPFWAATLIDRLFVMLLPLLAVALPVIKMTPSLYTWRIRSRIVRWYGELKLLEQEIVASQHADATQSPNTQDPHARETRQSSFRQRLQAIEQATYTRAMPVSYAEQVYQLRANIDMVGRLLNNQRSH